MTNLIIAESLKFLGIIVTGFIAIYSISADRAKTMKNGRLTDKGKVLIAAALLAALVTMGTQIVQFCGVLESAEMAREKHELTASKLDEIADRVQTEGLLATPIRRITLIVYFSDDTSQEKVLQEDSLSLKCVFMRGGQSEFRLTADTLSGTSSSLPREQLHGVLQLEGRDQRVAVPFSKGAMYFGVYDDFAWLGHQSTSLWIDIGFHKLTAALQNSSDGQFEYWPYHTIADLKDIWLLIETNGPLFSEIESTYLRINESLFIKIPESEKNIVKIESIVANIERDTVG